MSYVPRCLKCRAPLPYHDAFDGSDAKPHDGAIAICFECGEAMIFEGRGFRSPTAEEFSEMLGDNEFAAALAAIAVKVSKAKDPAAVLIDPQTGRATVLANEPDEVCEMCGKMDECRSYGPRKADGVRMRVCLDCADKDRAETERAMAERFEGR
jgi:hypothetical protein